MHKHDYSPIAAMAEVGQCAPPQQLVSLWSEHERCAFEHGICTYGKDFDAIHRLLPSKSVRELIGFFYERKCRLDLCKGRPAFLEALPLVLGPQRRGPSPDRPEGKLGGAGSAGAFGAAEEDACGGGGTCSGYAKPAGANGFGVSLEARRAAVSLESVPLCYYERRDLMPTGAEALAIADGVPPTDFDLVHVSMRGENKMHVTAREGGKTDVTYDERKIPTRARLSGTEPPKKLPPKVARGAPKKGAKAAAPAATTEATAPQSPPTPAKAETTPDAAAHGVSCGEGVPAAGLGAAGVGGAECADDVEDAEQEESGGAAAAPGESSRQGGTVVKEEVGGVAGAGGAKLHGRSAGATEEEDGVEDGIEDGIEDGDEDEWDVVGEAERREAREAAPTEVGAALDEAPDERRAAVVEGEEEDRPGDEEPLEEEGMVEDEEGMDGVEDEEDEAMEEGEEGDGEDDYEERDDEGEEEAMEEEAMEEEAMEEEAMEEEAMEDDDDESGEESDEEGVGEAAAR